MNGLGDLAEAARHCVDPKLKLALRNAFDLLHAAAADMRRDLTADNLTRLNCAWAHGAAVLKAYHKPVPAAPLSGGLTEGAELQEMAA